MKRFLSLFAMLGFIMISCSGCGFFMKPFEEPVFEEVGPKETAFVLPMEGEAADQDVFASADLLRDRKVAARRIPIERRWIYTGRRWFFGLGPHTGKYIELTRVVKVDRTPVTRVWSAAGDTGTSERNQSLMAESNDSIEVSSGFTITAWVEEQDAHIFLYRYQGVPLADVIDNQVFNSVQTIYSEVCNRYDLKELRGEKQEITDIIRERVIPFYKEWGITIAEDCGLFGGLSYIDPEIQRAINDVFIAQQQEQRNDALLQAQEKENERLRRMAENEADIVGIEAQAEAGRIREISEAIEANAESYIALQQLRLLQEFINNGLYTTEAEGRKTPVWDGRLPTILNLGAESSGLGMLLETDAGAILPTE